MERTQALFWSFISALIFGFIILGLWGCPRYNVYSSELSGKAEFIKAEQNRQIVIEEAKARLEAEKTKCSIRG